MSEIQSIIEALITFRDQRNWKQFHNTKDLALALSIEAAELNELFLWKEENEAEKTDRENIQDELADILAYAFLLAEKHDFNIKQIILEKIKKNKKKYPVEKSKNSARKYNEL
ncbi:MAG: nucleotide pyrophosphohydrolase [Bacteroidales bacterium]|jgi:NTP pyrophosphatase (non-canonical NTP hydrolase)|nr:nucleotide pyrophosphohydrolase [Bacteroidales bacterium]